MTQLVQFNEEVVQHFELLKNLTRANTGNETKVNKRMLPVFKLDNFNPPFPLFICNIISSPDETEIELHVPSMPIELLVSPSKE